MSGTYLQVALALVAAPLWSLARVRRRGSAGAGVCVGRGVFELRAGLDIGEPGGAG